MQFKTIEKGSTGEDVKILQALLRGLQYTGLDGKAIEIDGICGSNTVYAINHFQSTQRAYGYECGTSGKNDSIFGAKCWARLLGV